MSKEPCFDLAAIVSCGGKVFGHEAKVLTRREVIESNFTRNWADIDKTIHRKGSLAVILRAARKLRGFVRVEAVTEYTEEQWFRVFGYGSENGAKQWRDGQKAPVDNVARFAAFAERAAAPKPEWTPIPWPEDFEDYDEDENL